MLPVKAALSSFKEHLYHQITSRKKNILNSYTCFNSNKQQNKSYNILP